MADTSHNDHCCDEHHSEPEKKAPSSFEKIILGINYAAKDIWGDLAGWFFLGILIAGIISVLIPDALVSQWLGGGVSSMLIMLILGIPLYICATASTPIAAAFIMKGVSPGAALVFLLAGPATNVTSLTVLTGVLGKRTAAIYLSTIAIFSVFFGILVDKLYLLLSISPQAVVGTASEMVPHYLQLAGALVLILISIKPFYEGLSKRYSNLSPESDDGRKLTILGEIKDPNTCAGGT